MIRLFKKRENQDEKLIRNLKRYEEKEIKQQESKILGQKLIKRKGNKKENTI